MRSKKVQDIWRIGNVAKYVIVKDLLVEEINVKEVPKFCQFSLS